MTRVLVTGFEPFGGQGVNPSRELLAGVPGDVATAVLPVSYARAGEALRGAVRTAEPDVVVCFGQRDGGVGLDVERFAHNLDDSESLDNDGAAGSGGPIDPGGPVAVAATLPVDRIVAALRDGGIPAAASRDAGGFLCNHVFYVLMRTLAAERPRALGGFVHVPMLPEQTLAGGLPSMPLETLVRAAAVVVATCLG